MNKSKNTDMEKKINNLLRKMTIEEKIGQLCQFVVDRSTGPEVGKNCDVADKIRKGKAGSILNVTGVKNIRKYQEIAVKESRLGIPLIFGFDVIHGYKTIFPVPLAMASSWDLEAIEKASRVAAIEASAAGLDWTFTPMVDIARDPRWGRIVEGAGEDPHLGSLIAKAQVKGFQGDKLDSPDCVMACAKHYIAYGAVRAGKDYDNVDVSERELNEVYLPPFKAALDAGAGSLMAAFNDVNGIPMHGNRKLIRELLFKKLKYDGLIVSDWNAIDEMIPHGYAENRNHAALLSLNAGVDMDMVSGIYESELPGLVKEGKIPVALINEAVKRVLRAKFRVGLFDNPFIHCNEDREKLNILSKYHRESTRDVARKSMVLLKNESHHLPLKNTLKTIAIIGPLADSKLDMLGSWYAEGEAKDVVTILEGIKNAVSPSTQVLYSEGCKIEGDNTDGFIPAIKIASKADIIIAVLGEAGGMSGEAHSRGSLAIPGRQNELLAELKKTGKPIVLVLCNGRPLTINWAKNNIDAILEIWFPGTEAGNAVADVLFGKYNPSGKLPVTFPYSLGQIPIYHYHRKSGRPFQAENPYSIKYIDMPSEPLYPFGYGLSYTIFEYSDIILNSDKITMGETLKTSITVVNTGPYNGRETVQLYLEDVAASVAQPVKKLIGFKQVDIKSRESETVEFSIKTTDMAFLNEHMKLVTEKGLFRLYIGTNSENLKEATFMLM
ncbi:MAG: glycoside hydrolase family 3 N-terminal domain-containing protein [Lentisphaerota bacterium]